MVHGVVIVRKEKGMTSFGVVSRMRRIFNQKKIGHTGTLDPDAEGVLPVCLGKATKLVESLSHGTKSYRAVLLLGKSTDTQDVSGRVLAEREVLATEEEVRAAVLSFAGRQLQLPPMYSALKVNGQKLVDLARRGVEVERKPREVELSDFVIHDIRLPRVDFSVTCSHGTYIRTLCADIGERLGCGGCLESLLRTRVEEFRLEDALTLREIEEERAAAEAAGKPCSFLLPVDHFYRQLAAGVVGPQEEAAVVNGGSPSCRCVRLREGTAPQEGEQIRLYLSDGRFAGTYRREQGRFRLQTYYLL